MRQARLIRARQLTPSVRELTFDPGRDFSFEAGQWVSFRIPLGQGQEVARSYSIASAPNPDGLFDIAVTRVEDGPGSRTLHEAKEGESMGISRAQGFFTLEESELPRVPIVMVATGTGVSPFRSMLQQVSRTPSEVPQPVALVLGVRTEADLLYREEFEALERSLPGFEFLPTLSRGSEGWIGARGYVQEHLWGLVRRCGGDCAVYVCGLSKMVKHVRELLKGELALPKHRIHSERYD